MSIKNQFPKQYKQVLELVRLWIRGEFIPDPRDADPCTVIAAANSMYQQTKSPSCTLETVQRCAGDMRKMVERLETLDDDKSMGIAGHLYFSVDGVIVFTATTNPDNDQWQQDLGRIHDARDLAIAYYGLQALNEAIVEMEVLGSTLEL
ncbi:MAG: hypothetical protein V4485_02570 [Pseudomonadota bacterium]